MKTKSDAAEILQEQGSCYDLSHYRLPMVRLPKAPRSWFNHWGEPAKVLIENNTYGGSK